jgi:hypothetical protein
VNEQQKGEHSYNKAKTISAARIHEKVQNDQTKRIQKDQTIGNGFIYGLREIINKSNLILDHTRRF